MTATLHVIRVFVAPDGGGGNSLGVFLDGAAGTVDVGGIVRPVEIRDVHLEHATP